MGFNASKFLLFHSLRPSEEQLHNLMLRLL
jgi:hypothetical protein